MRNNLSLICDVRSLEKGPYGSFSKRMCHWRYSPKTYEAHRKRAIGDCNVLLFCEVHSFEKGPYELFSNLVCTHRLDDDDNDDDDDDSDDDDGTVKTRETRRQQTPKTALLVRGCKKGLITTRLRAVCPIIHFTPGGSDVPSASSS